MFSLVRSGISSSCFHTHSECNTNKHCFKKEVIVKRGEEIGWLDMTRSAGSLVKPPIQSGPKVLSFFLSKKLKNSSNSVQHSTFLVLD